MAYGIYVAGVLVLGAVEWAIPRRWPARSARVLVVLRSARSLFVMLSLYAIWLSQDSSFGAAILGVAVGAGIVHLILLRPLWSHLPKALRGAR
ncbi:hypothetical protein L1280_001464 [Deinococcus sp. HSC-46F16]|uniref:hypothetical protein n=1 Tax=Deinococcus sp. HSC-46F16 TaxID=2910968 RepID=UPI0020A15557|nr:hypothetical protein [Deinococcus sp. HSC-46F16]MCP2014327.1 hypothetical protein [Deinococcus sp. HSC-46F16]